MTQIKTKTLNDVCELIVDCEHKTALTQATGYPSIRTPNIGRGRLILDNVNRVSEETYKAWTKRAIPQADDLILAREAPVGNVAIIPKNIKVCLGQRTVLIRPNKNKVEPNYLVYLLLGDEIQGKILSVSNGATVHHLNMKDIRNLELPELPSLPVQRKIAAILSAYDDLIENNTRRIEILEEMARSIYREWFVNFRFPGHEQAQMVDSELGPIPEGWEVVCLGKLASFQTGKLNSNAAKPNGVYPFFTCSQEIFRTDTYSFDTECVLLAGNNANGVFHIKYFKGKFDAYQRTYVIRSLNQNQVTNYYLYFAIKAQLEHLKSISTGSATKFLTLTILNNLNIIVSLPDIQEKFAKFIFAVFSEIELLQAKNANLRKTRDLLLPRLISGEIDVENLEIKTGEIAA
jgi:type I restriction enzyme, S subunit